MIKKIYDRDTGNIYDVGADNKLKLVAEGTLSIQYDDNSGVETYGNIYNFEDKKTYLISIQIEEEELICNLYGTMINNRLITTSSYSSYDDCQIYASYIKSDKVFNLYTIINQDSLDYSGCIYKIYELPFSM